MTALSVSVNTGHPASPRLLRWLVRLHRPALWTWAAVIVVLAAALLWLGGPLTDASGAAWRHYDACRMGHACHYDQDAIVRYKDVYNYTTYAVLFLPFAAAAWAGGSLIGREMETGTARLAWTQGIRPTRWLAAKLAAPAVLVTAGTGLLVLLHHRAWSAGDGRIDTAKPWYSFETFYANGPVPVALALAGLAGGALIGLVSGRSLAALGGGAVLTGALWFAGHTAMPHLWPTVTSVTGLDHNGPTGSGLQVDSGLLTSAGARLADPYCGSDISWECHVLYTKLDAVSFYKDYHPASHFWPLQLMTSGLLLAVAALFTLALFRLLKRRTAA
ncbi:ABC transporter permease [Streptomyces sp. NPDC092369]|uniref:ABC transporter permease n=1 Tax=Streptomyces sp. NPDC092369 TaxID=3366015 RepID=UPI003822ADBD